MKILLIESGTIETEWLQDYARRYEPGTDIVGVKSMQDADAALKMTEGIDLILLDPKVHDALAPGSISNITLGVPTIPIVILETGKVMHHECTRIPQTRVYHLKTDVTTDAFLRHLKNIIVEVRAEDEEKALGATDA